MAKVAKQFDFGYGCVAAAAATDVSTRRQISALRTMQKTIWNDRKLEGFYILEDYYSSSRRSPRRRRRAEAEAEAGPVSVARRRYRLEDLKPVAQLLILGRANLWAHILSSAEHA